MGQIPTVFSGSCLSLAVPIPCSGTWSLVFLCLGCLCIMDTELMLNPVLGSTLLQRGLAVAMWLAISLKIFVTNASTIFMLLSGFSLFSLCTVYPEPSSVLPCLFCSLCSVYSAFALQLWSLVFSVVLCVSSIFIWSFLFPVVLYVFNTGNGIQCFCSP